MKKRNQYRIQLSMRWLIILLLQFVESCICIYCSAVVLLCAWTQPVRIMYTETAHSSTAHRSATRIPIPLPFPLDILEREREGLSTMYMHAPLRRGNSCSDTDKQSEREEQKYRDPYIEGLICAAPELMHWKKHHQFDHLHLSLS